MRVYFDERNVLVIDGEGVEVKYNPDIKTTIMDAPRAIRNFSFIPKPMPVNRRIDDILVSSRFYGPTSYRIRISILEGSMKGMSDEQEVPGDIITIESAKEIISALKEAIEFAEAEDEA